MLGETVKAFIQKGSTTLTFDQIDDRLRSILPPYKCPMHYEWIIQIPVNAMGKKQRRGLMGK
jgi:long-chain acyl-CoA synthetase